MDFLKKTKFCKLSPPTQLCFYIFPCSFSLMHRVLHTCSDAICTILCSAQYFILNVFYLKGYYKCFSCEYISQSSYLPPVKCYNIQSNGFASILVSNTWRTFHCNYSTKILNIPLFIFAVCFAFISVLVSNQIWDTALFSRF